MSVQNTQPEQIEIIHNKTVAWVVLSCDAYSDLWKIYFESFFKYWESCPLRVYLATGSKTYEDSRVKTIHFGEDESYSSNLIKVIELIEEEYVVTTTEDIFLCSRVNQDQLFLYFNSLIERCGVYLKLLYTYPIGYDLDASVRIAQVPSNVKYRIGMGTSLWDKEILKQHLVPGMSAWQMEKEGEFGSNIPNHQIYSVNYHFAGDKPFNYVHGVAKGRWIRQAVPWLVQEGFSDQLKHRNVCSLGFSFYVFLFSMTMSLFIRSGWKWRN